MAVTYSDIITEESIRREVLEEVDHPLQFRQVFTELNISDTANDTIKIPKDRGVMAEPDEVGYGSEFPRDKEEMELEEVSVKKYGLELELWREAIDDSMFDVVARNVEKQAKRMNEFLDRKSFEYLNNNYNTTTAGDADGELTFPDITDAQKVMQDEGYNPDFLITTTQGQRDLLHSPDFQRSTDLADDTVRSGQVGRVAGMDVVVDTFGRIGQNSSDAFLVDTDEYGWEVVKDPVDTDSYEDNPTHSQIYQIWTRRGWYSPRPESAVLING